MQPEQSKKLIEERNIRAALLKLSKSASRENQRLDALRQAWTSHLRQIGIINEWNLSNDPECGALIQLDKLKLYFGANESKKKFRRAIYITGRIGHKVEQTDLFIFTEDFQEISIPNTLNFKNIDQAFELHLDIFGLEIPVKSKLKDIDPNSTFNHWGALTLNNADLGKSGRQKNYRVCSGAPKLPILFGLIDLRISGVVPSLCDKLKQGALDIFIENGSTRSWEMVNLKLQSGKLTIESFDRRTKIGHILITTDLKVTESTNQRKFTFQIRSNSQRTIFGTASDEEMNSWIQQIRKHKENLKKWNQLTEESKSKDGLNLDALVGSKSKITITKHKRRSKSVEVTKHPTPKSSRIRRDSGPREAVPVRREWMNTKNRVVPKFSPAPVFDPNISEMHVCDETVNDILDNVNLADETFTEIKLDEKYNDLQQKIQFLSLELSNQQKTKTPVPKKTVPNTRLEEKENYFVSDFWSN